MHYSPVLHALLLASLTRGLAISNHNLDDAGSVLTKLLGYYYESPNVTAGIFDQSMSPWWESGSIWETYMDYAAYTLSNRFEDTVSEALVASSYGIEHDFFGINHTYVSLVVGRWNDDVEWYAQAVVAGAEIYGPNSYMPGLHGNGTWIKLAERTIDEVYAYHTNDCGGGIYWSTDPSQNPTYKSGITNIEFIGLATRTYLLTRNETMLQITVKLFDWMVDSGLVNVETGWVGDGVDTTTCVVSTDQWSYSYGHLVGGLSYLYEATRNESYLDYAEKIAAAGIKMFAPTGVAEELCEADGTCNQDQEGFKAIFLRHLAYFYRQTKSVSMKSTISNIIQASAKAALATCDRSFNCTGSWTEGSSQSYPTFRSTHLVAAALVAQRGISI